MPVIACHDEIVIECDIGQAEQAAEWLKKAMLDGMAPLIAPVPLDVEASETNHLQHLRPPDARC